MTLTCRLTAILLSASATTVAALVPAQAPLTLRGVDHVPVAVRDLAAAGAVYQRLGFVLKPGAPHPNGITNLHAKFPDGTEIELITAPKAVDAPTTTYVSHLEKGDGPAFLSLHAANVAAANSGIPQTHPWRQYMFFGGLNHSPTDRPEHFAHPNTAGSLLSVWLAADDFTAERDVLRRARVPVADADVRVPESVRAPVATFDRTTLILLPGRFQRVPGRRIVGATVAVRSLDAAAAALRKNGLQAPTEITGARSRSMFLPPEIACGWWLELREATGRPRD